MDDAELLPLFNGDENDHFERKESWRADTVGKVICAFANDLADSQKPGILFIGQKDDGKCAGLSIDENLLNSIADLRNNILPSPIIEVVKKNIASCPLAVVMVKPLLYPPARYSGRCYVRIGASTRIATPEEERTLVDKNNRNIISARHFDRKKPYLPIDFDDLDWLLIEREYLPAAISKETLVQNDRPREMQLSSLRFLTSDGSPNNAAVLCFHPNPRQYLAGAYIQFVKFNGDELSSPGRDNLEINGPVFQQIRQIKEKLKAHISESFEIGAGRQQEGADYPFAAVYQAICNAVMHRDYEHTNAPAHCYWFSDRIEIYSPGGVFGSVTTDNFGDGKTTDYRNPVLAEALKNMGFVEKFGAGIATIKRAMSDNDNPPPKFTAEENHVVVILPGKRP